MVLLRRVLLVGIVWLTATMTLVAGIPRYDCVCPDGSLKLFCPGCGPKERDCCYGVSKKPTPPKTDSTQPEQTSCCGKAAKESEGREQAKKPTPARKPKDGKKARQQRGPEAPNPDGQVDCKGCGKKLAEAAPLVIREPRATGFDPLAAFALLLTPSPFVALLARHPVIYTDSWLAFALPPPTSRVIVFQHFVI